MGYWRLAHEGWKGIYCPNPNPNEIVIILKSYRRLGSLTLGLHDRVLENNDGSVAAFEFVHPEYALTED